MLQDFRIGAPPKPRPRVHWFTVTGVPQANNAVTSGMYAEKEEKCATVDQAARWVGLPDEYNIQFSTADGTPVGGDHILMTGMQIQITDKDGQPWDTIDFVVHGDVIGTGTANITQLVRITGFLPAPKSSKSCICRPETGMAMAPSICRT